jgi:hypothetical protein
MCLKNHVDPDEAPVNQRRTGTLALLFPHDRGDDTVREAPGIRDAHG